MRSERVQRQIDRLLDEAEQAIAQRDWLAVRLRAKNALALDPDNYDARAFLVAAERAIADAIAGAARRHRGLLKAAYRHKREVYDR